ncbi:MAG TPA: hypothetical protein VHD62_15250 [Opitutaceae bacterium]|nr:hypothetical protein [Opitutaceae bacterium]
MRRARFAVRALGAMFAAAGLATVALAAEAGAGIEFVGVLGGGSDVRVALAKTDRPTEWVAVGKEFAGYVVSAFDAKTDEVVLTRNGETLRLHLKQGKVKAGTAAEPSPEVKRALLNNLRQLAAAADQFYLENGRTTATLDELVGETKYVRRLVPVDGEDYRQLVFAQGKALTLTTASGYTISYAP